MEDFKDDFSYTEIVYMIKILKHIQSNNLNRKIDIARALNTNKSNSCLSKIIKTLEIEECISYNIIGREHFMIIDEKQLRWSIEHQKNLKEFKYFFKREVKI